MEHQTPPLRRGAVFAVLISSLTVLAAGCSRPSAPTEGPRPPLPVTVIDVQPTRVPLTVEAVGQTEGAREVEVRARVGGILQKRLYEEGAPVKAGQVLFQIDRAPFEIAVADARAKADQAAREMARLKGLLAQQAVSQKEFDDAQSSAAVTQAALQQAQLNLSYTSVASPVAGSTGRAAKSEGNLISTGDSLLTTVVQLNPIWVRFSLSDNELAQLPGGRLTPASVRGVEVVLPDGSTYPVKGRLNFAGSQIDPKLGTLQLRAEFANADGRVLPGQFVRARLTVGQRDSVFLVPQAAVAQSDQGRVVFVANGENKVEPRPVKTGEWQGKDWVVLGGLKAGDRVIVDNLLKLRPGAPVAPHKPGEKPAGMPPAPGAKP
ncbi:MAG: efflux RND transporter periplasmic adaptor subunit [Sulfuricella sp.]|nr:efflux RND transporter periplasmic adaptor subunit [Sulfuricella sp.]